MNIVFGSNGSLGKELFQKFLEKDKEVIGFDIKDGPNKETIVVPSLSNSINEIEEYMNFEIDSISFCQGLIDFPKNKDILFSNYKISREIIEKYWNKLKNDSSICFISSVHAVQSNESNLDYAFSKSVLESYFKNICLNSKYSHFSKTLLRLGAMESNMLKENVENLDKMIDNLPSKNIIQPQDLSEFIYDYHSNHKKVLNCSVLNIDNGITLKLSGD
tara:strand:- start:8 stop:661 length:654 start_codon:yes stop_codon:yes gene_type:complete